MQTVKLSVLVALCACARAAPVAPSAAALAPGPQPVEQEPSSTAPSGGVTAAVAAARLKKSAPGTCITVSEPGKAPFTLCNPAATATAPTDQSVTPEARTFGHLHHDEELFKPKIKFVKVPVIKHLKVPVAAHEFEPHYGGHRFSAASWLGPEQTFASGSFDQFRDGEQQALAATAIEAEMALQAHLMNEQARNAQVQIMEQHELEKARAAHEPWLSEQAFEQARHAQARIMYQQELEQARFAEAQIMYQQQLEHARQAQSLSTDVAGSSHMAAHGPSDQGLEQARAAQAEQALTQQVFEASRLAQLEQARSSVLAPSYAPLPFINNYLPTMPVGGYAAGVFPASAGGGGCGALPLLFSCSPQLVRGHVAHAAHAAHGGGGGYYPAAAVLHPGGAGGGGSYRETEHHPGSPLDSAPHPAKDEKKSEAAAASAPT